MLIRRHGRDHRRVEAFHHCQYVVALYKRHLKVELRKFGLAIAAQVFIAEAAGDLEIAIHTRYHEQLLELLRRLREGVELARVDARGTTVVEGTLRRGLEQDRGLDFDKSFL